MKLELGIIGLTCATLAVLAWSGWAISWFGFHVLSSPGKEVSYNELLAMRDDYRLELFHRLQDHFIIPAILFTLAAIGILLLRWIVSRTTHLKKQSEC